MRTGKDKGRIAALEAAMAEAGRLLATGDARAACGGVQVVPALPRLRRVDGVSPTRCDPLRPDRRRGVLGRHGDHRAAAAGLMKARARDEPRGPRPAGGTDA